MNFQKKAVTVKVLHTTVTACLSQRCENAPKKDTMTYGWHQAVCKEWAGPWPLHCWAPELLSRVTQQSSRGTPERRSPEMSECLRQQETGGEEHLEASWEDRALPGTHDRQNEDVANVRKCYQWLEKAQRQPRPTSHGRTSAGSEHQSNGGIYHTRPSSSSRPLATNGYLLYIYI